MQRAYESEIPGRGGSEAVRRTGLLVAVAGSVALSSAIIATASGTQARVGLPETWPWLLTALQVLALWSAGSGRWWGWLVGAAVQPSWIAYAVVTAQLGFIPGCVVSAAVQTHSFLTRSSHPHGAERRELGAVNHA
jgi:hypothetical protein